MTKEKRSHSMTALATLAVVLATPGSAVAQDSQAVTPTPTGISLSVKAECAGGTPTMVLSWTALEGQPAATYDIYRDDARIALDLNATEFRDEQVRSGGMYKYRVTAQPGGVSVGSNSFNIVFSEDCARSAAFTLAPIEVACDGPYPVARLRWTPSARAASYEIMRDDGFVKKGLPPETTTYQDLIMPGIQRSYMVIARNPAGMRSTERLTVNARPCPVPGGDSTLVVRYTFEEPIGVAVADSSGFGNHGSLLGKLRQVSGKLGQGLRLDPSQSQHIAILPNGSLRFHAGITIALWLKLDEPVTTFSSLTFKIDPNDDPKTGGRTWLLALAPGGARAPAGIIHWSNRVSSFSLDAPLPATVSEWHHIAVTYCSNPQGPAGRRIYSDGVQSAQDQATGQLPENGIAAYVGGWGPWPAPKGVIDELRIYTRALSAEEIAALAQP